MSARDNSALMPFSITYDRNEGRFNIRVFDKLMLGERLVARISKNSAILQSHSHKSGHDHDGCYERWQFEYRSAKNKKKTITCMVVIRETHAIFETKLNFEVKGKSGRYLYGDPYVAFPCFEGDKWDNSLSCISYKRQVPFNYPVLWQGKITASLREGKNVPLIATNAAFETLVLAPLNKMLFNSVAINHHPARISCGLPKMTNNMKKGSKIATILVYGVGVNKTLDHWGELLRRHHGVAAIEKDADVLLESISYWTNAGSAYWYNTYRNTSYEKTLRQLKNYHQSIGLNFGSYQMDSWWYKKEGDLYTSGIVEWEPKGATRGKNFNSLFASRRHHKQVDLFEQNKLSYVQSFLKTPLGCHFKQLSKDSVYYKNNPDDFIMDKFPVPKNKKAATLMFMEIFNHPRWNLTYVIHDWLSYMFDNHRAFQDMDVLKDYFNALNKACRQIGAPQNKRGHLSVQYCMALPNMTVDSGRLESVTTIRSTCDSNSFLVEGTKRWWWHLYSSRLITALGKYPFYDNRYSSKSHTHPLAAYSKFEFIWIGLSCGPLGIGDHIGRENVPLIRRCIKHNGQIIKPDVPAMPLDKCFLYNPHTLTNTKGVAVFSYSAIKATIKMEIAPGFEYRVYYLLVYNPHPLGRTVSFSLRVQELPDVMERTYVIYNYFTHKIKKVIIGEISGYRLRRRDFHYEIIAPLVQGIAIFGDVAKHVAMSNQLIAGIEFHEDSCTIKIAYSDGTEKSQYLFYLEMPPEAVLINGVPVEFNYEANMLRVVIHWSDVPQKNQEVQLLSVCYP